VIDSYVTILRFTAKADVRKALEKLHGDSSMATPLKRP